MKLPQMTISPIGKIIKYRLPVLLNRGFTFIEVMVALIILSVGIVAILKVFIVSLDQLSYLSNRVYATIALDNKIIQMSRSLNAYNALALNQLVENETIDTGAKNIEFKENIAISEVLNFPNFFLLDGSISWMEKERHMVLVRSTYLSNIHFKKE